MKYLSVLLVLTLALGLFSCSDNDSASLQGIYSIQNKSQLEPFIKKAKEGETFFSFEFSLRHNNWRDDKKAMESVTDEEFKKLLGADFKALSPVGLKAGSAALIKIKPGSTVKGEFIKTGYVLVSILGPVEVHKSNL